MTFSDLQKTPPGAYPLRALSALVCLVLLAMAPAAQAAITITASTAVNPARPAEYLGVEFTVANTSAFSRNGVVVEMTYPASLDQLFETAFEGACAGTSCTTGELITWTLGTIPAGGAVTIDVPALVSNITPDGTIITFSPSVTDSIPDSDATTLDIEVQTDSIYDLSLSENSDPAAAGAQLTYKLTYGYRADAAAVNNSTLRFPIPANATFVSATGGGVLAAGSVDWGLGFLSPGDGGVREVTVQLDGGLTGGDVIQANSEIFAISTPTEGANSQANTAIAVSGGLQLSVESNANPARAGEVLNTQLTVVNTDPFTRIGVVLSANYPQDMSQFFETEFDGDCPSTSCTFGELITWTLGDIGPGQSVTVDMAPTISNIATGGVLINLMAMAKDSQGVQTRQTDTIRLQNDTIYDLSVSENRDPAIAGSSLSYKLTYGYREDAAAVNNSLLRLPLPAGTTFVSATDGGALNGAAVEWALGFLSPGDGGVREVTVLLDGGLSASTVIEAAAEVASVTAPGEMARAEANTVIAAARGLQLAVESNANPARISEYLNLSMTVTNHDGFARFGVELTASMPQDLSQQFETEFDGNCSGTTCTGGERITWLLGQIGAGETVTVTLPPVVSNVATSGALINFFMSAEDDQGVQTRQMDTIRIQSDAIYDLSLSESRDPSVTGSALDYKLSYGYRSDAAAVNESILRLPLPADTTFVSATGGGVLNNGAVEWALGFLSPGDGGVREATLQLGGALPSGTVIEAAAEVSSVSSPIERARAEANTVVAVSDPLQLAIEINPEPARPSELANYRLTVTNNDPFTRFGVILTGRYPQDLNQTFETIFDGNCGGTTCSAGERLVWALGNIPAGDSKTVDLPPILSPVATDGVLINLFASAQDDQGAQTRQMDTIRVQSDAVYDLAITDSGDPVTPGSMLTYKLTLGYREDAAAVNDSTLRLHLPDGVTFISATGGGVLSNGHVDWSLGFLSPGDGGIREATVMLDGGLAPATVLEAVADVFSVSSTDAGAHAETNTVVRSSVPLSLDVNALVFTGEVNRRLNMQLTVTNNDPFTRFGVSLNSRFPQDVSQLFESDPEFAGDCLGTSCNFGEVVSWPLVDIPAGQSVTVTLPPTVAAPTVDGRLINFLAWVEDDQGVQARAAETVVTGCIESLDNDCDGILDSIDNCLGRANTSQRDSDGDGIGNACDADIAVPNNCLVNVVDLGVFKSAFFATPASANWNPAADFNADDVVNAIDLGIIKLFFFQVPGPSALPNACSP